MDGRVDCFFTNGTYLTINYQNGQVRKGKCTRTYDDFCKKKVLLKSSRLLTTSNSFQKIEKLEDA